MNSDGSEIEVAAQKTKMAEQLKKVVIKKFSEINLNVWQRFMTDLSQILLNLFPQQLVAQTAFNYIR